MPAAVTVNRITLKDTINHYLRPETEKRSIELFNRPSTCGLTDAMLNTTAPESIIVDTGKVRVELTMRDLVLSSIPVNSTTAMCLVYYHTEVVLLGDNNAQKYHRVIGLGRRLNNNTAMFRNIRYVPSKPHALFVDEHIDDLLDVDSLIDAVLSSLLCEEYPDGIPETIGSPEIPLEDQYPGLAIAHDLYLQGYGTTLSKSTPGQVNKLIANDVWYKPIYFPTLSHNRKHLAYSVEREFIIPSNNKVIHPRCCTVNHAHYPVPDVDEYIDITWTNNGEARDDTNCLPVAPPQEYYDVVINLNKNIGA